MRWASVVHCTHQPSVAIEQLIEEEMTVRIGRLKERIELGIIEDTSGGAFEYPTIHSVGYLTARHLVRTEEGPVADCDFNFYGQIAHSDVSLLKLQEVESEIDHPTGISTVHQPKMQLKGVLMSKNCAMVY